MLPSDVHRANVAERNVARPLSFPPSAAMPPTRTAFTLPSTVAATQASAVVSQQTANRCLLITSREERKQQPR